MPSPPDKFKIVIADKVTDNGHDGVLNGIFVVDGEDNKVFPNATTREAKGWHTYPDAYMYLYCGQVLTDKEDMPARDEEYEYVCYERTFLKGWNSVCLPFGIKTDDFKAKLGESCKLAVYKEYNDTENKIQFYTVSEVAAGVPCLIWSENSDSQVSLNINVAERGFADSPDNSTALKGSFTNATIGKGKLKLSGENSFSPTTADDAVTYAYRAYVEVPAGHAKALTIDIDGETTTIGAAESVHTSHATVYTVGGVQAKKAVRGLNIMKANDGNVKKVMAK